jgi:hypothetical protein
MELSHTLCKSWSRNRPWKLSHCRTRNHLWKLSRGRLMESTTNTNSRLTHEINETESSLTHGISNETVSLLAINLQRKHNRCRPWNHNWNLSDSWRVDSTARPTQQIDSKNRFMTIEREIIVENWVAADWWNRQRTLIHDWRMKSTEKIESSLTLGFASETTSLLTRNRQRKHNRCRPWNHNWNVSDSWRVESTARPTHQIDRKNRFMANTWKCETHSANADPKIDTENWVTIEREIIFENWVVADWWNRHRTLIHDWCMKSIEKRE